MALPAKLNLFCTSPAVVKTAITCCRRCSSFGLRRYLTIDPRQDDRIHLLTPVDGVPDEQNLIVRAARLLQRYCDERGLQTAPRGSTSASTSACRWAAVWAAVPSNAATVLVALNELWRCGLGDDQLAALGLSLGADVPVFVRGHAAFAEGIGERLQPAEPQENGIWWRILASASRRRLSSATRIKETPRFAP